MTGADLAVLGRTVRHLRPGQVAHRARLRAQQAGLRRFPEAGRRVLCGPDPSAAAGWPDGFSPLDALTPGRWPGLSELRTGKIRLLGLLRGLEDAAGWDHDDAPRLWRFHLHYWDWAWGLDADPDRLAAQAVFARLWRSWQASARFGRGDAWHPYPAALRAWSWCGLHHDLAVGTDIDPDFIAALATHAGFLRRHLEYDVGGNHLIKGLKALVGLAIFFADERLLRLATSRLIRQLNRQILADGGHYERAPAYHCQVLADLVDVADLLRATDHPAREITAVVDRMRHWLGAVLTPDGQVPLLNDGYPVDRELLAVLRPGPDLVTPASPVLVLPETGLVRAAVGGWHLLADVGPPCPPSLPAHAHADTFGCLVHVDKVPLLIDTGTSTYEPGPVRRHERSTAAHSTVQVDGADSTEVWGIFRAGRRARVSDVAVHAGPSGITCEAVHDGFRCLPGRPLHHRRWSLTGDKLQVEDLVTGRGRHEVVIRWQLAVGTAVRIADGMALVSSPAGTFSVAIAATGPVLLTTETRPVAAGFRSTTDAPILTCRINEALPVRATTVWSRARDHSAEGAVMKQVVQPVSGAPVEVLDVPRPVISPTDLLVRSVASVISAGTERAVTTAGHHAPRHSGRRQGPGNITAEHLAASQGDRAEPNGRAREVLRLFEAKAVTWPAKYAPDGPLAARLACLSAAVRRYAGVGNQVLDLGCGTGELARALAASGLHVTGCDISPQMLLRAARDRGGCAGWVRLEPDWRTLPFASAAFDVVVASSVLEYVADPAAVLRECARVLRPGGVMLYTVPDLRHPVRWAEWCAQWLVRMTGGLSEGGRRSWWNGYNAYLRTSLQRHRFRWWLTTSWLAGLRPAPCRADRTHSPLRLLESCCVDESLADEEGARQ